MGFPLSTSLLLLGAPLAPDPPGLHSLTEAQRAWRGSPASLPLSKVQTVRSASSTAFPVAVASAAASAAAQVVPRAASVPLEQEPAAEAAAADARCARPPSRTPGHWLEAEKVKDRPQPFVAWPQASSYRRTTTNRPTCLRRRRLEPEMGVRAARCTRVTHTAVHCLAAPLEWADARAVRFSNVEG